MIKEQFRANFSSFDWFISAVIACGLWRWVIIHQVFLATSLLSDENEKTYLAILTLTLFSPVPSEPPQNVRAISVTSDEAVITWSEPPRLTLHGVLKGYRVVFWSLFPDGGGCCGGPAQWPMQSNYHLFHSKIHQPTLCLCQDHELESVDVSIPLSTSCSFVFECVLAGMFSGILDGM